MCSFCHKTSGDTYLVNPAGGYGREEMWACRQCLESAEADSLLAARREKWEAVWEEEDAQP